MPYSAEHKREDRKSTRLNSSHLGISYAVFCLKKKNRERPGESVGRSAVADAPDDAYAGPVVVVRGVLDLDVSHVALVFFFFNDPAATEIYTLSLHDALPI